MNDRTILYIAPQIPYPLNSGTPIREFHILSAYATVRKVRLAFYYRTEAELAAIDALKPYCASIHPVPRHTTYGESTFGHFSLWRRRIALAATLTPSSARLSFSRDLARIVEDIAPSADLIHVGCLHMVPHVESLLGTHSNGRRFILDLDDVETVGKSRELQIRPPVRWRRRTFEYLDFSRLWWYQRKAIRAFDRVFVCSEHDRGYFPNDGNITVVPNGAHVPSGPLPDESDGKTLLYLGSFSYWPNADGLFFFLKDIFPLIAQQIPGVRLLVVGRQPPPEVSALHDGRTIFVHGDVPSVEDYYRQATVSIVPLRFGAGTRLKILEAFALGRTVVSTSMGCEGLEVVNGEHLSVADDPLAFAAACVELLRNPALRARLVSQARTLVEKKYTWASIQNRVEHLARELLDKNP